jgi:thermitase
VKEKLAAVFIVSLILLSALSLPFVMNPTFAASASSDSKASGLVNKTPASLNATTSSSETAGYNWDKWNFSNVNAWSKYSSTDGNESRLIIGVNTQDHASLDKLENVLIRYQATIVDKVAMEDGIKAVAVELPLRYVPSFVGEVRANGMASYVEPSMKVQATFTPDDPFWNAQWGPQKVGADWAWNTTVGSQDVLVAVVDTGIDYNHPDLAGNYVPLGFNWVGMNSDPRDDFGHGTHCAGIIGAVLNNSVGIAGLAQVHIMAEKVLDSYGSGYWDWVANGIINATDCGAKIISMSLGGYGDSQLVHDAVKYAYSRGVLLVAAAGNDNTETKSYPAAYEEVVAVAATDQYDNKAYFSNWGDWIELAAPGVGILSTMPTYYVTLNGYGYSMNYDYLDGTSMACPHVAGVAALIWSLYPNKTRDWVRLWLRDTADDLGTPGFDQIYGYGRVDARKAVEQQPPEHELIASELTTPRYVLPGTMATINGTVLNFGRDTESNVDVQLLTNDTVADSVVVDSLDSGCLATISFQWASVIEGSYNVTFYVVPKPGESNTENNFLSKFVYVGTAVKAVVLRSSGNVDGRAVENWQVLSNDWQLFGGTFVDIDYTTLNKLAITYQDIAATGADVLIISCAYDPYAWQFTDSEIEAITQYVHEGHGLIVTAGTLYDGVPNNKKLAPLLGIKEDVSWTATYTDLLQLTNLTHPLFTKVPNPLVFPQVGTALSTDGRWDSNELAGGKYLALGHYLESSIVTYRGLVYISPWLEIIPAYYQHHLQLLYDAILWSRYQKPQHELVVSLDAPAHLNPGESTLLNATVFNEGLRDETDVQLQLFIDSASVEDVTIPELPVGSSYTISYPFTPTAEGAYNVTAYAPAILGEDFTDNNLVTKTVVVLLITVRNVLVYSDDYAVTPGSRYVIIALNSLGISYTYFADDPWGFDSALTSQSWDLVVVDHCNYYALGNYWNELDDYVRNGGRLVLSTFDIDGSNSVPTTLWDTLGVRWVSDMYSPEPVYRWIPSHPIFTFPNTVGDLTSCSDEYWDNGDHVAPTTGTAVGGFTSSPGTDDAAIVVGNAYPTVLFSFILDEFRHDDNGDGKLDAVELWENAIVQLARGSEHDVAVRLNAPGSLELNSAATLDATVTNRGLSNETNVQLSLLIDDNVVDSTVVTNLDTGQSSTISYAWTPATTTVYNITAWVQPVPEESYTADNVKTIDCFVYFYTRWYVAHAWDGSGWPMGWHADDSSWEYDLPFDFPFYGGVYQKIYVSSNGLITFNGPDSSYHNSLPALSQKLAIAVAWMDWVTYYPFYDIYTYANSSCVVIRWIAQALGSGAVANFEAILDAQGIIRLNYGDCSGGVTATVGISDGVDHMIAEDVADMNNINTIVFVPFQIQHDVAVTSVEASETVAKEGSTVDVTVVAKNQGLVAETFNVSAYATPTNSTVIYFDNSSYMFDASTVAVGDRFNVTLLVRNVEDFAAWEVKMYYDDSIINVTRWFEPTWDPQYVFYKESTMAFPTPPDVMYNPSTSTENASALVAVLLFPNPPEQPTFYGSGKLCTIEFEITALPGPGQQFSCPLSIDNEDTYYLDSNGLFPIFYDVYNNGYYWCGNGQTPPPPLSARYPIGTEVVDLGPGESISVVFPWNIVDVPPHNYTLWAEAEAVPGEIDTNNNICSGDTLIVIPRAPPEAVFTYSPSPAVENQPATFDASNSTAPDSHITGYKWDFGDGNITSTAVPVISHTYVSRGTYNVTLKVYNSDGMTGGTSEQVDVWRHDVAVIDVRPCVSLAYEGSIVDVNVTVTNLGDSAETVSLSLYYNITDGSKIGTELVVLSAGETKTLTLQWNTAGVKGGYNYTLAAIADVPVESDLTNNIMEASITIRIRIFGDINDDGRVDITDVSLVAKAFGSNPTRGRWNPICDLNGDGRVDIQDVAMVARNFGRRST